eukprot:m.339896 g.339896  ORF g.339896 m.339896 type:complete len:155 (-) comp19026_c0_seq1:117-581(-)
MEEVDVEEIAGFLDISSGPSRQNSTEVSATLDVSASHTVVEEHQEVQEEDDVDEEALRKAGAAVGLNLVTRKSSDWVPDKSRPKCRICQTRFTVKLRRHHCRFCGEIICKKCSPCRVKIPGRANPVRACKNCVETRSEEIKPLSTNMKVPATRL